MWLHALFPLWLCALCPLQLGALFPLQLHMLCPLWMGAPCLLCCVCHAPCGCACHASCSCVHCASCSWAHHASVSPWPMPLVALDRSQHATQQQLTEQERWRIPSCTLLNVMGNSLYPAQDARYQGYPSPQPQNTPTWHAG